MLMFNTYSQVIHLAQKPIYITVFILSLTKFGLLIPLVFYFLKLEELSYK